MATKMFRSEKDLFDAVDRYWTSYGEAYVNKAADLLTKAAKSAIEQFYEDYPMSEHHKDKYGHYYYYRTNNLLRNSYQRQIETSGGQWFGGVVIDSSLMNDNYNGTPEQVTWSGWHGWHGLPPSMMGTTYWTHYTHSPLDMLYQYYHSDGFRKQVSTYARLKTKKDGHFYK